MPGSKQACLIVRVQIQIDIDKTVKLHILEKHRLGDQ